MEECSFKLYVDLAAESPPQLREALDQGLSFLPGSVRDNLTLERMTAGGSSAQLYRFSTAQESFVLRILDPKGCREYENRKNEVHALQDASRLGLAPRFICSDPEFLICVAAYVQGRHLHRDDLQDKTRLEQLGLLLKKLHSAPHSLAGQKAQLSRTLSYFKQAKTKGVAFPSCFAELFERFVRQAEQRPSAALTFNHGDLHPGNILLAAGQCLLIDWAYASADYHLSDVAYLTLLSGMDRLQSLTFYDAYLGRGANEHDLELLEDAQSSTCLLLATALFNLSATAESLNQPLKERVHKLDALLESSVLKNVPQYISGPECIHPRKSHPAEVQLCALAFLKECINKERSLHS